MVHQTSAAYYRCMESDNLLRLGTCSWKYSSWKGLVYSKARPANYLQEYCSHYSTVEVDQWFWSLFAGNTVVLPKADVVREYLLSVPDDFKFGVKVPNSITLTHHYSQNTSPVVNPHFLSVGLMERFLQSIEPLWQKLGPLIFQFEYLNKQKMANQQEFMERFAGFAERLSKNFHYAVEIRNPNYLNDRYFEFLVSRKMSHVFLHGYYMPPIFEIYRKYKRYFSGNVVIRLHGRDRKKIEELTNKKWDKRVAPQDRDIDSLTEMLADLQSRRVFTYLYVNNHFEGSAPRTIAKLAEKLQSLDA